MINYKISVRLESDERVYSKNRTRKTATNFCKYLSSLGIEYLIEGNDLLYIDDGSIKQLNKVFTITVHASYDKIIKYKTMFYDWLVTSMPWSSAVEYSITDDTQYAYNS